MTQTVEPMFLVMANDVPVIMCEQHAKVFEKAMMIADLPHTIFEMDDDQSGLHVCQVCNLKETMDELNRPKLILPGEF